MAHGCSAPRIAVVARVHSSRGSAHAQFGLPGALAGPRHVPQSHLSAARISAAAPAAAAGAALLRASIAARGSDRSRTAIRPVSASSSRFGSLRSQSASRSLGWILATAALTLSPPFSRVADRRWDFRAIGRREGRSKSRPTWRAAVRGKSGLRKPAIQRTGCVRRLLRHSRIAGNGPCVVRESSSTIVFIFLQS